MIWQRSVVAKEKVRTIEVNDYVVYIHKNILNGKVYVGQTCNLSERWRNNGKNYFNSIKLYNVIK